MVAIRTRNLRRRLLGAVPQPDRSVKRHDRSQRRGCPRHRVCAQGVVSGAWTRAILGFRVISTARRGWCSPDARPRYPNELAPQLQAHAVGYGSATLQDGGNLLCRPADFPPNFNILHIGSNNAEVAGSDKSGCRAHSSSDPDRL